MSAPVMNRFDQCLAVVLQEETGYPQKAGGPFVRIVVTNAYNKRRAKKGEEPLPLGKYVLVTETRKLARVVDGQLEGEYDLPTHHDGCAFDDHPKDPGGRTGMGILQREYNAYRKLNGLEPCDVWAISDEELATLYKQQYWDAVQAGNLPTGLDLLIFDIAVNQGVGIGIRMLQRSLDTKMDGHLGIRTVAAAREYPDTGELIEKIKRYRDDRYRGTANFATFGENWMGRSARIAKLAMSQTGIININPAPAVASPAQEPDAPVDQPATAVALVDDADDQATGDRSKRATTEQKTVIGSKSIWAVAMQIGAALMAFFAWLSDLVSKIKDAGLEPAYNAVVGAVLHNPVIVGCLFLILVGSFLMGKERLMKIIKEGI